MNECVKVLGHPSVKPRCRTVQFWPLKIAERFAILIRKKIPCFKHNKSIVTHQDYYSLINTFMFCIFVEKLD